MVAQMQKKEVFLLQIKYICLNWKKNSFKNFFDEKQQTHKELLRDIKGKLGHSFNN